MSNPVANFSFTATLLAHKRVSSSPLALRSPILTQSLTVQVLRDCKLVLSVQIFNLAANCAPCKRTTFELEKPNGEEGDDGKSDRTINHLQGNEILAFR